MVTSDDRVAELIETVARYNPNREKYPAFDLVVTPLATGSKNYIEWVKLQTIKKDNNTMFFGQENDPYNWVPPPGWGGYSNGTNHQENDPYNWVAPPGWSESNGNSKKEVDPFNWSTRNTTSNITDIATVQTQD